MLPMDGGGRARQGVRTVSGAAGLASRRHDLFLVLRFRQSLVGGCSTGQDFLEDQHAFQRAALESLGADPRLATEVAPEAVERNRRLVAATDRMSLEVCWGIGENGPVIPDVPTAAAERTSLTIRARDGDPSVLTVDPWPFAADRVEAGCEGRRLREGHSDETRLRIALRDAERVGIRTVLLPR